METEYGVPLTVAGARQWARLGQPRPIRSAGSYAAVCRRINPSLQGDGRLIAVGFNAVPPREWTLGQRRDGYADRARTQADFAAWWTATQPRPETVGSDYNASPEVAFAVWSSSPAVRRAIEALPVSVWAQAQRSDGGWRRRWLRHARAIGRALRRGSLDSRVVGTVSAQALRRLGEMCPELQRAALRGAHDRAVAEGGYVVRLRHLDWALVARLDRQLRRDTSGRVRAAFAYHEYRGGVSRRFRNLAAEAGAEGEWSRWLCPAYPHVPTSIAARIALGESPAQISDGVLTRREAHQWLSESAYTPAIQWLTRALPGAPVVRSALVARWLLDVHRRGGWGALTRTRVAHGPAGQTLEYTFVDRIDEIQDTDLARGHRTSVTAAFESAAQRAGESWAEQARRDHRVLASVPRGWRLYPCMRALVTPAQLEREGREMGHCVGGYAYAVEQGQSIILSLSVAGHRSTAEISPAGQVMQHYGEGNSTPHRLCQIVLNRFVERRIG